MAPLKDVRTRRRVLSWLPTALVALVCVGFVVGAIAMQNSWWTSPTGAPAADQQASDGSSRFDQAGIDYLTRDRSARIKLRDDAEPATDLGLAADGDRTIEPLVPVTLVILGSDGAVAMQNVSSFEVSTSGDRIAAVTVSPDLVPSYQNVQADLATNAARWGWSDADLQRLTDDLAAAAQGADGAYGAELPTIRHNGIDIDAHVTIDGGAMVAYTFSRAAG